MKLLSAYTIASNCTDLTDIECGIEEIEDKLQSYFSSDKKAPYYFYVRLKKLREKRDKLLKKEKVKIRVNFSFDVDEEMLRECIKSHLHYNREITEKSLLHSIKNEAKQKGLSLVQFPEFWGDYNNLIDEDETDVYFEKFRACFGL